MLLRMTQQKAIEELAKEKIGLISIQANIKELRGQRTARNKAKRTQIEKEIALLKIKEAAFKENIIKLESIKNKAATRKGGKRTSKRYTLKVSR